ncbi:MAG: glycosyltransferase family 2 protein [Desulfamplus sp.]|nr:glycosyltransferase family 2 protein [Desulfamplus sp.]
MAPPPLNEKNNFCVNEKYPRVDVIIVNYNGLKFLPGCLDSLFGSLYPNFRVVIVDNASTDGSRNWIRNHYPRVKLICSSDNEGFGRANARGVENGDSPYVALLNNDTMVENSWLNALVDTMKAFPDCAAACSRLLFMDHPEVVNAQGGGMNKIGYGYDHEIFSVIQNNETHLCRGHGPVHDPGPKDVLFPTAAACLIRRSAFYDAGGFDPSFFMYHEDVDLGWRFHLRGYSVKYVPHSIVYHAFGGTSMKSGSMIFRNRLGIRHALRSLLKNYELPTLSHVLPLFFRINWNNHCAGIPTGFFRALLWNTLHLPGTIVQRSRVQRRRKKSDTDISPLIWQDIHLPVYFPDYRMQNRERFQNALNNGEDRPNVTDAVEIADPSTFNLGYGWYPWEIYFGDGTTPYRWTRNRARFFFHYSGKGRTMVLKVLGLARLLGGERTFSVKVSPFGPGPCFRDECNDFDKSCYTIHAMSMEYNFKISSDDWEFFHVPIGGETGFLEITLCIPSTWSPNDRFANGDYRRLGIGVAQVEILRH